MQNQRQEAVASCEARWRSPLPLGSNSLERCEWTTREPDHQTELNQINLSLVLKLINTQ